jgi:hypothetical protein
MKPTAEEPSARVRRTTATASTKKDHQLDFYGGDALGDKAVVMLAPAPQGWKKWQWRYSPLSRMMVGSRR